MKPAPPEGKAQIRPLAPLSRNFDLANTLKMEEDYRQ